MWMRGRSRLLDGDGRVDRNSDDRNWLRCLQLQWDWQVPGMLHDCFARVHQRSDQRLQSTGPSRPRRLIKKPIDMQHESCVACVPLGWLTGETAGPTLASAGLAEGRPSIERTLGGSVMTINLTGVAILAGLSILVALPVHAQPNRPGSAKPDAAEFAALERPVTFEISASTGTLKETAQLPADVTEKLARLVVEGLGLGPVAERPRPTRHRNRLSRHACRRSRSRRRSWSRRR